MIPCAWTCRRTRRTSLTLPGTNSPSATPPRRRTRPLHPRTSRIYGPGSRTRFDRRASGVENYIRQRAADADEAQALIQLLVADGERHVLVDLTFQAPLDARRTRAAAAVVGEMEAGVLGLFEDVLVLRDVNGNTALLEGYFVGLRHVRSRRFLL